ncbi:HAD family hydrolase [Akkermansiaceae bacterium]|nr:HAD family hydrolase [Akkermansiaceae bacterium]
MLRKYANILWDFDGVIIESNLIREKGFVGTLANYPKEKVEELLYFHRENGGLSRYIKYQYFFENILNIEKSQSEIMILAQQFSDIVIKDLVNPKLLIKDSLDYLKRSHKIQKMDIASGSDEIELQKICYELKLGQYFNSINGSPREKAEIVNTCLKDNNYKRKETCLIGDSKNDFEAALSNGIDFYGFNNPKLVGLGTGYITNFDRI